MLPKRRGNHIIHYRKDPALCNLHSIPTLAMCHNRHVAIPGPGSVASVALPNLVSAVAHSLSPCCSARPLVASYRHSVTSHRRPRQRPPQVCQRAYRRLPQLCHPGRYPLPPLCQNRRPRRPYLPHLALLSPPVTSPHLPPPLFLLT